MNVHFVYFEGMPISWVKNLFMLIAIPLFIAKAAYISKAVIFGICFWLSMTLSAMFHPDTFRFSTLGYSAMLLITFMMVYNLLYKGSLTLELFNKLIQYLIFTFVICHIAQQLFMLVNLRFMPLINLSNQHFLTIYRLPSLTLEPSVFARIMGVLMYAYLKGHEYAKGDVISLKQIMSPEHRWVFISFFWSMFTMGSGTAFIVMAILSLYFVRRQYLYWIIPVFFIAFIVTPYLHIKQLDRVLSVVESVVTLDTEKINDTDGSAATRINPMINTIKDLDLSQPSAWLGNGIDSNPTGFVKKTAKIGGIDDFGIISYLFSLLLVFGCCIKRFFSVPTLMFFIGVGGGTGNIQYGWGLLLIFMCVRYFSDYSYSDDSVKNEKSVDMIMATDNGK